VLMLLIQLCLRWLLPARADFGLSALCAMQGAADHLADYGRPAPIGLVPIHVPLPELTS